MQARAHAVGDDLTPSCPGNTPEVETGGVRLHVIERAEELETVREFWKAHEQHPNAAYDLYQAVLHFRPEVTQPLVFSFHDKAGLQGLLLARVEADSIPVKLGYTTLARIPQHTIVLLHDGLLGTVSAGAAGAAAADLLNRLCTRRVDRLYFAQQREDHPLVPFLLGQTALGTRLSGVRHAPHWLTDLPAAPGEFLLRLESSHRRKLLRYERQLSAQYSGRVRTVCFRNPEQVAEAMAAIEVVAQKTYQRGLGVGFQHDGLHRQRFESEAKAGRLRIWVLYAGDAPIAFRTGFIYGGRYHGANTGYDESFSKYSVGLLLLVQAIEELVREGVRVYDWGMGDASHKQRFGTGHFVEVEFSLYGRTCKALTAYAATTASQTADSLLRSLLLRLGMLDRIKRWQRRRLADAAGD